MCLYLVGSCLFISHQHHFCHTCHSASALVTTLAMLVHTRSIWLTLIGLAQIIISFPLAFFFYNIVLRLTFFPFLNFIGVFVTFALGADDVFVAVDKVNLSCSFFFAVCFANGDLT
jgi:hypothetical protein